MSVKIIDDKGDRITVVLSPLISGDMMVRSGQRFVYDLEQLTIPAVPFPLDWDHKDIIGEVTKITRNTTGGIDAVADIVSAVDNDTAANIIFRLRGGMRMGSSPTFGIDEALTYTIPDGETMRVNGRDFVGPMEVTTAATLDGAAITPFPTDRNTMLSRMAAKKAHQGADKMTEEVKEKTKEDETLADESVTGDPKAENTENPYPKHPDLKNFLDAFPDRNTAIEYYLRGLTLEEAQAEDYAALKEKRAVELSQTQEEEDKEECSESLEKKEAPAAKADEERKELKRSLAELSVSNDQLKKTVAELSRRVQKLKSGTTGEAVPVGSAQTRPGSVSALSLAAAGIEKRMQD